MSSAVSLLSLLALQKRKKNFTNILYITFVVIFFKVHQVNNKGQMGPRHQACQPGLPCPKLPFTVLKRFEKIPSAKHDVFF